VILASACEILRKCFGGIGQVLEKNFYRLPFTPPLSGRLIGPSAEFCPRVAGPTTLVGRWGHQGHGTGHWAVMYLKCVLGSFVFCFLRK
jgi:hypothetical protein